MRGFLGTWKSKAALAAVQAPGSRKEGEKQAHNDRFCENRFSIFRVCSKKSQEMRSWREGRAQGIWWILKVCLKLKRVPCHQIQKQMKCPGALHGWTDCSWPNSKTKRKQTEGGTKCLLTSRDPFQLQPFYICYNAIQLETKYIIQDYKIPEMYKIHPIWLSETLHMGGWVLF